MTFRDVNADCEIARQLGWEIETDMPMSGAGTFWLRYSGTFRGDRVSITAHYRRSPKTGIYRLQRSVLRWSTGHEVTLKTRKMLLGVLTGHHEHPGKTAGS